MISIDAHKCFIKQYSLSKIVNKGVEDIEKKFSKIVKDEKWLPKVDIEDTVQRMSI